MPMVFCNASATFQSLMSRIFYDCLDAFPVVYMDDLLIYSKDEQSHLRHIELVLSRAEDHKLYLSPKKCEWVSKTWYRIERTPRWPKECRGAEKLAEAYHAHRYSKFLGSNSVFSKSNQEYFRNCGTTHELNEKGPRYREVERSKWSSFRVAEEGSQKCSGIGFAIQKRNLPEEKFMRSSLPWEVRWHGLMMEGVIGWLDISSSN